MLADFVRTTKSNTRLTVLTAASKLRYIPLGVLTTAILTLQNLRGRAFLVSCFSSVFVFRVSAGSSREGYRREYRNKAADRAARHDSPMVAM